MQTIAQAIANSQTPQPVAPASTDDSWRPELDAYDASLAKASAACAQFVAEMAAGLPGRWLTLSGPVGCGKTMLARQVFAQARRHNTAGNAAIYLRSKTDERDRRPNCVWLDVAQFASRMRGGEYDLPEYLGRDFMVVLDDVGAERDTSGFIADALFRFCNARLGKWTLFTTNLTHNEIIERIDARVASRLIRDANRAVKITAGDYALRKAA